MAARGAHDQTPTSSSGSSTPALSSSWTLPSTVSHAMTDLLRRFSSEPHHGNKAHGSNQSSTPAGANTSNNDGKNGVFKPPHRTASPFQPPPLYPITLKGYHSSTSSSAQLLSRTLAEEIRLLVPPRLQLCEEWNLVYSLDQDGVSLGTLYKKCDDLRGLRNGFVLVVKDGDGGLFGAYLTEAPHPSPHYYGTGECFLWRASILSPPARPATSNNSLAPPTSSASSFASGTSTPDRIRFKAFPYSGVNDYMILCETGFLSVGGGDGHYGLWLDDTFEKGISSSCPTFGNEPLSDEGEKFDILGVEIWSIGNLRG